MFTPKKNTVSKSDSKSTYKWCDYVFEIYHLDDFSILDEIQCVFIISGMKSNRWIPYYVSNNVIAQSDTFDDILFKAISKGATHLHIAKLNDSLSKDILIKEVIKDYQPSLNIELKEGINIMSENVGLEGLNETREKLDLLYKYEAHYLELIKNYKEEIKFANTLQEDLRRERSQFFTQTLKEVIQTMKNAEIEKDVSAKWVADLVDSYTKSIDLSGDLAKTHVVEILSLLTGEAKKEASNAKLDNITNKMGS